MFDEFERAELFVELATFAIVDAAPHLNFPLPYFILRADISAQPIVFGWVGDLANVTQL